MSEVGWHETFDFQGEVVTVVESVSLGFVRVRRADGTLTIAPLDELVPSRVRRLAAAEADTEPFTFLPPEDRS